MAFRTVVRVRPAHRTVEGGGFVVRRSFPVHGVVQVDPFLLLDELGPVDHGPGEAVGAPEHPHRGFETVTYLLAGEMEHRDSAGHRGRLGPGDVQWMTAGRGVVHSELPSESLLRDGGRLHGFQLWVNLPARDKMTAPRYQELPGAQIPKAQSPDGLAQVVVLAGSALGVAAAIETRTPIAYHHWTLRPGAQVHVELPPSYNGFVYVFQGEAHVGKGPDATATDGAGPGPILVEDGHWALLEGEGPLPLTVPPDAAGPAQLLVIAGEPLREPVARYGPFVMNTKEEIGQALIDHQMGRLGTL